MQCRRLAISSALGLDGLVAFVETEDLDVPYVIVNGRGRKRANPDGRPAKAKSDPTALPVRNRNVCSRAMRAAAKSYRALIAMRRSVAAPSTASCRSGKVTVVRRYPSRA